MNEKLLAVWRDKATQKFSFAETDEADYRFYYSEKHGYLYEKNGGDCASDQDEPVDLSTLVKDEGVAIVDYEGLADFLGIDPDCSDESEFRFCKVCNDYRYLEDELSECGHLFFSVGGEWRGSGDTERGECPYDDYLKKQILKFAEITGCKADLIQALKQPVNKESIQISGSWSGACIQEFVINGVDYEGKAEDMLFEDVQQGDDTLESELSDGFDALMTLVPQYYGVILEFLMKSEVQNESN